MGAIRAGSQDQPESQIPVAVLLEKYGLSQELFFESFLYFDSLLQKLPMERAIEVFSKKAKYKKAFFIYALVGISTISLFRPKPTEVPDVKIDG